MSAFGQKATCRGDVSLMSALPLKTTKIASIVWYRRKAEYFCSALLRYRERHRPHQCRDTAQCSLSWYDRAVAANVEPPFGLIICRATIPYLETWGDNEATQFYWFARRCCRLPIRRARAAGSGRPPYRRAVALRKRQSRKARRRGVPPGIATIRLA